MRPRDACRLKVPDRVPEMNIWVSPAFFTYAQATPDWFATAVLQRQKMIETILSPRMTKRV